MKPVLDSRLHPVRPDIAARGYEERYLAGAYVDGREMRIIGDLAAIRREPRADRSIDTEGLYGETFTVYEETPEGWAWGQLKTDGYVGYLPTATLAAPASDGGTVGGVSRVAAIRSFRYPGPELKSPPLGLLSMGARVQVVETVTVRGLEYACLADGAAMVAKHLVDDDHRVEDWVSVAESLVGTPYLWGGRSSLGLDCSALIQLAAQAGGISLPRDSDMQEKMGVALDVEQALATEFSQLRRGDLIFWRGHVGVLSDEKTLLHANGYTMDVSFEPLAEAVERIGRNEFGAITSIRRL